MEIPYPKLNERAIAQAIAHIKKFPEAYSQNSIVEPCEVDSETPCGSIGCFGGWLYLLNLPKEDRHAAAGTADDDRVLDGAAEIAGLTDYEKDFVFASAENDDAKKHNVKLIESRLKEVRRVRAEVAKHVTAANLIGKLAAKVDISITFDEDQLYFEVEDKDGARFDLYYSLD